METINIYLSLDWVKILSFAINNVILCSFIFHILHTFVNDQTKKEQRANIRREALTHMTRKANGQLLPRIPVIVGGVVIDYI